MEAKIFYKSIKNPILKVTPNLEVILNVPLDASQKEIDYILAKRKKWIAQKLDFFKARQMPPRLLISGEDFFYLGKRYRLKVIKSTKEQVALKGKFLEIHLANKDDFRKKDLMIKEWYHERAKHQLNEMLLHYTKILKLEIKSFSIRPMKTRWGSCHIKKQHIVFNLELIKKPKRSIEYVVLHELAHLKHPYHNKNFSNFLDLHMPNWKEMKKRLEEKL